jgi:hypothetical protein
MRLYFLIPLITLAGCEACGTDPVDSVPADTGREETGDGAAELAPISGLAVTVNEAVVTILELSWTQDEAAERGWVEYRFDDEVWLGTPPRALEVGEHSAVVLGIPAETEVELRVVNQGEVTRYGEPVLASTGALPADLLVPTLISWDPTSASERPWLLGSVDAGANWYQGPCWSFILDRLGRVVWYHQTPGSRLNIFSQVAADGTHLLIEGTTYYTWGQDLEPIIDRMSLDKRVQQRLELPDLGLSFDEIPGGSILYNAHREHDQLVELYPDGSERVLFDCDEYAREASYSPRTCMVNAVVYNQDQGSVFWSMFENDTVVELDYESGEVLRRFGQVPGGWAFEPSWAEVDYQHYPNYSPDGTVIASTHSRERPGVQYAHEYVVDDDSETMVASWTYGEEVLDYARYGGEAFRLDNGNTFICYGTGGAVREVTPDRRTAWELEWPLTPNTHLLGHFSFIDDLYALNEGPAAVEEVAR